MQEQKSIHYRVGGRLTHAGIEMLPDGKDIERIIIARIEYKESETVNGRVENGVWIAHFAPNPYTDLPFILNATNRKRLVKQFPECDGYPARLENVPVRLTRERTRDVQDGGETWGLRISKLPAADAPATKKKSVPADKVDAVADWAAKKGLTIEQVEQSYELTPEVRKRIAEKLEDLPNE